MSGGNCRKLRNAMFVVALLAVIAVGFVAFESDDSFAETKSEAVKDGSANTIGNYEFDSATGILRLTATSSGQYDSIPAQLVDLTVEDQKLVKTIILEGFRKDLSSFFNSTDYPGIYSEKGKNIIHTGEIDISTSKVVGVARYTFDTLTSTYTINWKSGSMSLGEYSSNGSSSPFKKSLYYFNDLTTTLILDDYTNSSHYPFTNQFDNVTKFIADDIDFDCASLGTNNNGLLNGLPKLRHIVFNGQTGPVSGYVISSNVWKNIEIMEFPKATSVMSKGFTGCTNITEFVGTSIQEVGSEAFKDCKYLATVKFETSVSLGVSAFSGCIALSDITEEYITTIGKNAFYNCTALAGSFNLERLSEIDDTITSTPFYGTRLTDVKMSLLKSMPANSFKGCSTITSINAPLLIEIGANSFDGCVSLTTATFGTNLQIGESAFSGCSNLSDISEEYIVTINDDAFKGCIGLTSPLNFQNLTSISTTNGVSPFSGSGITSMTMPSLTSVPDNGFKGCTTLTYVSGVSLALVNSGAFEGCSNLATVVFGKDVQVRSSAFSGCVDLSEISEEYITTIADDAFKGCSSLTEDLDFQRLTSISITNGVSPFSGSGITSVYMPVINSMSSHSFSGCTSLVAVSLNTLVTVPQAAFKGCSSLASFGSFSVLSEVPKQNVVPSSVTSIGASAFEGTKLANINLNNVTSVGNKAFYGCLELDTLTTGEGIQSIGDNAFENSKLSCELSFGAKLTSIGQYAFANTGVTSLSIGEH
ncbi:MAG: leucine-rich repeat protein, partial [Candidatus Methanomethylophilaceae archaeon]|nr:leucine-rich repeat protein [Candidatus Methanomethylophilaceae archaeon]